MNAEQLGILQHALGVDRRGRGPMHRNHYCAGGTDVDACKELVALGLMEQFPTTETLPYFNCYVTEEGKRVVRMVAE